ncbi:MAG: hypothetical protein N3A66_11840, partial [Planctomycetota bacterium]|nr:hypothetical protein [Planctomycetota bacterium]
MTAGSRQRLFLQFGAGNIGRSLCGQIFSAAGYEVVFVDAVAEIVAALNRERRYRIVVKDDLPPGTPAEIWVEGVRGILASDREAVAAAVAKADLIGTAVGAGALPHIFPLLAAGLARRRRPVSIIFCENLHDCVPLARRALRAALPPTASVYNPIDIIGDARSDRYRVALRAALDDPNVDAVLVLFTP